MSTTLGQPCGAGINYRSFSPFLIPTCKPSSMFTVPCSVGQKYFCSRLHKCVVTAKSHSNNGAFSSNGVSDRQKALEAAMNDINSSFGKGSVTRLGSAGGALVETFPSGCLTLDLALSGGLPKGRVVEIYGPESSGKTTLALHAIAEVQKLGGNAMLVDAEHAFDPCYSKALGVDIESLIVCQPDSGEMALETADRMCRSGAVDLICIDSVSALTPRAEIEGEIGMQQIGLQARLMSQALRKMSGNAAKAGCTLIFLNQIRYKIGVFYGSPEVTSGGIALKFFASLRLEIRSTGKIKSPKGDEDIGIKARVRVQKSKVSRPYKQAEFDIIFGEGVYRLGCILDCSEMLDVVSKKGSWYNYGDLRLGQGREKALQYLRENPLVCDEIEKVQWHPFMLDPTLPKEGIDKNEYHRKKFGQRTQGVVDSIDKAFQSVGFRFGSGGKIGNTLDSHRLIELAGRQGLDKQNAVVESLMIKCLTQEKCVSDREVLLNAAESAGIEGAKEWIDNPNAGLKEIQSKMEKYGHNISGVPHFKINDKYELSGAQASLSFIQAFKKASQDLE